MKEHKGIALVFARTDTKAWQNLIFPYADSITFLRGRINFCKIDGTVKKGTTMPSTLIAYSEDDTQIIRNALETQKLQGVMMKRLQFF